MTKWTDDQLLAIHETGKNIIVSAGAGSGKTAVLTERVIHKLKNGMSIKELLVLTFTNKAAAEMKSRIRKKLKEHPDLSQNEDLLDAADICTFDSFTGNLVRKYHYICGINPNFKLTQQSHLRIKLKETLETIYDELAADKDDKFIKLVNDFCMKSFRPITEAVLDIYSKLELKVDVEEYLESYISRFYSDEIINENIEDYIKLIRNEIKSILELAENLIRVAPSNFDISWSDAITSLAVGDYDTIKNGLINIDVPALARGCDEYIKEYRKVLKDKIDTVNTELLKYEKISNLKEEILLTKSTAEIIIQIIQKLHQRISAYKYENDIYDFNDIAMIAIRLIKENENIKEELKNNYKEIMVDEYQDTSDIQEELISMIANNNVYMVGDIKQSIYRFRNANPKIFKTKYDEYAKGINGFKIDLKANFRTREETINCINKIFANLMTEEYGGANYLKDHVLIAGNKDYSTKGKTNQNNNMEIYNYTSVSGFTKSEVEAFIIAKDIKTKINNNYMVYDNKEENIRPASYKDFTILIDRVSNFNTFKKIFEYMQIPMSIHQDVDIKNESDLTIIRNIINLIILYKNRDLKEEFRFKLVSILRSYLYNLKDEEIFDLVHSDISACELYKKIEELSVFSTSTSIGNLIIKIIDEFNMYMNLVKVGDVDSATARLEYIYSLGSTFSQIGSSLEEFAAYLDEIINDKNYSIKYASNIEEKEAVTLMNIHKSKGLEFPIIYFCGFSSRFNEADMKRKFLYDAKLGIILPYFNEGINYTFYKYLYLDNYIKDDISEKVRLLYVALTRTKEKMIIVTPNIEEEKIITNSHFRTYNQMLKSIKNVVEPYYKDSEIEESKLTKDYNILKTSDYTKYLKRSDEKIEYIENMIDIKINEKGKLSKSINKIMTKEEKEIVSLGTDIHYILEVLDFTNPNLDEFNISDYYKRKISKFLKLDILKNIKNMNVFKEYEFIYIKDNIKYNGIIDLMIENKNEIYIIDYKLKDITNEHYKEQLNGYKEYIENKTQKKVMIYLYSIIDEELLPLD